MPKEIPTDLKSLSANLDTLRQSLVKDKAVHQAKLDIFISKFGKPEIIARTFSNDAIIKRLALQAKKYDDSVSSVFLSYDHFLAQLQSATNSLNQDEIATLLAQRTTEAEYQTYRQLKDRKDRLDFEFEKTNNATPVERVGHIKTELKAVIERIQTYSMSECFLFNYFELTEKIAQSKKKIEKLSTDLDTFTMVLSGPDYQVKPSEGKLTFQSVIAATKGKKAAPARDYDSWGQYFDCNNIDPQAIGKKLLSPSKVGTLKQKSPQSSGEDWDAELATLSQGTSAVVITNAYNNVNKSDSLQFSDEEDGEDKENREKNQGSNKVKQRNGN